MTPETGAGIVLDEVKSACLINNEDFGEVLLGVRYGVTGRSRWFTTPIKVSKPEDAKDIMLVLDLGVRRSVDDVELRLVELGCRVIEVNGLIMQMVAENNLLRDDHRVTFVGLKKANP